MSYHSSCGHQMRAMELVGYEIPIDVWEEKKLKPSSQIFWKRRIQKYWKNPQKSHLSKSTCQEWRNYMQIF